MSLSVLFLILSCVHVRDVRGYPSGAPQSECVAMTPRGPHGASQTTTSPYQITTDALPNGYVPGETYTVSISKTLPSDSDFRGFLCQVRQVGRTTAVGTFSVRNTLKARTLDCSNENLCCYTFFIVWLNYVGIVAGYPSGAPSDHCTDMTPVNPPHGNRQPSSSPYRIISDAYSNGYVPGQTYNVSIEKISSASPNFRGFLCQVRQVDQTDAVGTLTPKDLSMSKTLDCTSSQVRSTTSNRATTILPTTKVSSSSSSLIATVRLVSQQPTTTTTTVMSASAGRQDTNLSGSQVSVVPTKQTASSPTTADGTSGAAHASPLILLLVCFLAIIILLL